MTRLSVATRFSLLFFFNFNLNLNLRLKPISFLSLLNLSRLSLSTLHLCKSFVRLLASKTLALFTMDNLFPNDDEFWDIDVGSRSRPPQRPRLLDDFDYDDNDAEKVYFVPFRWWLETQNDSDQVVGVLYSVSSEEDGDSGILLELRKEKVHTEYAGEEEGFSGREYALIGESMWLQALKRHNDFEATSNYGGRLFRDEDILQAVFPLQIRILVSWETNLLTVKINRKDNSANFYKRASVIFNSNSELFHIWDFSGQTNKLFTNNSNNFLDGSLVQGVKEVLLELQVLETLDNMMGRYGKGAKLTEEQRKTEKSPTIINGITEKVKFHLTESDRMIAGNSFGVASSMGLTGLQNLGNTCFMNSALQCLVHTPKLVDYFLGNFQKEINYDNPLGMKGELALAFGDLLRKLWAPGSKSVPPRMFKLKLANFAPQFSGYNQHDSQEFLSFLLDGLHEDLNRVKCKPYFEAKDVEGRRDEEVAEEYWQNHLARNDSIIVDLCQGQYRSTLVCPACNKLSVTFDPFMYLSLPLPSTTMRSMTLMVISCDGISLPSTFTVSVPKSGRLKDLIDALSTACSLRADETLLLAEVYKNRICRVLEDPSDSLALIRNEDKLVAYRFPRDEESSKLIVYMHQQSETHDNSGKLISGSKTFGAPFVAKVPDLPHESDIRQLFLKFLDPLKMPAEESFSNCDGEAGVSANDDFEMDDASDPANLDPDGSPNDETIVNSCLPADFTFYLAHQMGASEGTLIKPNEPLAISKSTERLDVIVMWPDTMVNKYDTCLMSSLPDVSKPNLHPRRLQESVDLYKCLEAFLKEEPLGPDDMWYCPRCKKPQQARKKLDLWRLPEILVIHLKRFSYSRFFKNKLETFVDFPIDDLDLSNYIAYQNSHLSNRYMLYAVSNHYGGMGAGHYTAYVLHGGKWYDFAEKPPLIWIPKVEEEMGSISGALSSHLQLSDCRFSARTSQSQLTSVRISPTLRRTKLRFTGLLRRRNFNRFVCSAVDDDVREKQTELGGGNGSTVVEDVPDIAKNSTNGAPDKSDIYNFLYPSKDLLPDDREMSVFDHLEELRQRIFVSVLAVGAAIVGCFAFSKDLILLLEAPVKEQGVRFLQLGPGEFFFTTLKVSGYCGLLLGSPVILYEIIAFVLPGLTRTERQFLAPIVLGSSILFYAGIAFSYVVLTPAALNFFVSYAEGAVESLWSIDQYFEFVLVLMFSTGLSFQVPVIQILLGQLGLVSGDQMLSIWRYVVVGAVVAAAVLTPSTDPLTQVLLAAPLLGLYLGGAWVVKLSGR